MLSDFCPVILLLETFDGGECRAHKLVDVVEGHSLLAISKGDHWLLFTEFFHLMSFEFFLAESVCDSEEVGRVDPYDPEQILRSIHTSNVEVKVA